MKWKYIWTAHRSYLYLGNPSSFNLLAEREKIENGKWNHFVFYLI